MKIKIVDRIVLYEDVHVLFVAFSACALPGSVRVQSCCIALAVSSRVVCASWRVKKGFVVLVRAGGVS